MTAEGLTHDDLLILLEKAILTDDEATIDDLLEEHDRDLDDADLEWLAHFAWRYNPEWVNTFRNRLERREEDLLEEDPDRYFEKYLEKHLDRYQLYSPEPERRCWLCRWWPGRWRPGR